MQLRTSFLMLIASALMFLVFGCDETTNTAEEKPVLAAASVSVPAVNFNVSDTCGSKAYAFASEVHAFIALANAYANPAFMTQVNGVWTYSVTDDGVTVTITAAKQSDGSYRWTVKMNGTDGTDGTVYANWTAMEASSSADGKSGSVTIYSSDPTPSTTIDVSFTWATGAGNMVTYDMQVPQENVRFVLLSNGTTGEVTEYTRANSSSSWVATGYHATWADNGAVPAC